MNYLKNNFNIKVALFSMALIIGICLFFLNRVLISNIREETTLRAKESSEVLSEMLNDMDFKRYGISSTIDYLEKEGMIELDED